MSKKFLDIIGLSRLVSLIKNDIENKADNSSLESLRNETNNKIDIINTNLSTKPNTQTVAEMISRNAAAIIGSNAEMSVGFTLQSAAFQAILEPSHITCLETGPWYKISDGVPIQCGSESGVYVGENDVATVMMDETLFYFLDSLNHKYQRIKLGDPTKPFGALMLPSGEQICIQSDATPTSLPTYIYAIADKTTTPKYIAMSENPGVESALFLGHINKIPSKIDAIEFYINATIEEALEEDPIATADLNFPTSQYYCTGAQTADSAPIWTLNSSFFDTNFTSGQFNTLNSGLTVDDKDQISTNKDDINSIKSNYVKFTDFATIERAGVIKRGDWITLSEDGKLEAGELTAAQYKSASGKIFVGKTTLNNVLSEQLSKKQDLLTFDDTPTASSDNPITSGGVYSSIEDVSSRIDNAESEIENVGYTIDSITNDIDNINTNIDNINTNIDNINTDIDNIHNDIDNINSNYEDLSSTVSDLDSNVSDLGSTVSDLDSDIENLSEVARTGSYNDLSDTPISVAGIETMIHNTWVEIRTTRGGRYGSMIELEASDDGIIYLKSKTLDVHFDEFYIGQYKKIAHMLGLSLEVSESNNKNIIYINSLPNEESNAGSVINLTAEGMSGTTSGEINIKSLSRTSESVEGSTINIYSEGSPTGAGSAVNITAEAGGSETSGGTGGEVKIKAEKCKNNTTGVGIIRLESESANSNPGVIELKAKQTVSVYGINNLIENNTSTNNINPARYNKLTIHNANPYVLVYPTDYKSTDNIALEYNGEFTKPSTITNYNFNITGCTMLGEYENIEDNVLYQFSVLNNVCIVIKAE